jgi:uncharacterized membrane protein
MARREQPEPDGAGEATSGAPEEAPDLGELYDQLRELEETVDSPEERDLVREALRTTVAVEPGPFGRILYGFDRADAAEALLGALVFGIPMFVEGGTLEVGLFLAGRPLLLVGTVAAAVAVTTAVLYVADIQDVRVKHRLLGLVPRRLAGVLGIALLAALVAMTAWGRVDWTRPVVALSQVAVAFGPMAVGAALGDILPGS